jgi:hypothetical protein
MLFETFVKYLYDGKEIEWASVYKLNLSGFFGWADKRKENIDRCRQLGIPLSGPLAFQDRSLLDILEEDEKLNVQYQNFISCLTQAAPMNLIKKIDTKKMSVFHHFDVMSSHIRDKFMVSKMINKQVVRHNLKCRIVGLFPHQYFGSDINLYYARSARTSRFPMLDFSGLTDEQKIKLYHNILISG